MLGAVCIDYKINGRMTKNRIARKALNLCCMVLIFFFQLLASAYAGSPLAGILRT
jgi:hypothetical protein